MAWMIYFFVTIAIVGFIFCYLVAIPAHLLASISGSRTIKYLADEALRSGTSLLMKIQPWLNLEVQFKDLDQLKKKHGRILFVSNHRSHLDVFIFLTRIRGIRIFANAYLFKVPFLGQVMKFSEQIQVEKGRLDHFMAAHEVLKSKILTGENVLVFPEHTRTPRANKATLKFSSATFKVAKDCGATIVPIALHNTDEVWPRHEMKIHGGKKIKFLMLDPIESERFATADCLRDEARERIEQALKQMRATL